MARSMMASDRGTQPVLLPTDLREALPADHMVWEILNLVDELDLSAFHAAYRSDGRGRPPYNPATMVALVIYCASKNIRGSRRIEAACIDDLGARIIIGNHKPDHSTIAGFVRTHAQAINNLLRQSLRLCAAAGLIDVSVIAGDGTKVQANAALANTVDEQTLRRQIADLQQQVAQADVRWQASITDPTDTLFDLDLATTTATTDPATTPGDTSQRDWRKLQTLRRSLDARQQALAHLLTRPNAERDNWQAKLERNTARVQRCRERLQTVREQAATAYHRYRTTVAAGAAVRGRRPAPPDGHPQVLQAETALANAIARRDTTAANPPTAKVNTTDPASRIMPAKHGGHDQMYNFQATASKGHQIILGVTVHDSPNDKQALVGLLNVTHTNLTAAGIDRPIGVALFDNGYASKANFTADLPIELLLVAVEKEARQTGRLSDDQSTAADAWQDMATQLDQPANKALYKQRAAIIEPVFAQLFNHFGHDLHRRGTAQIETELHIWAVSYNLAKLIRHRRKTRTSQPTRPPE